LRRDWWVVVETTHLALIWERGERWEGQKRRGEEGSRPKEGGNRGRDGRECERVCLCACIYRVTVREERRKMEVGGERKWKTGSARGEKRMKSGGEKGHSWSVHRKTRGRCWEVQVCRARAAPFSLSFLATLSLDLIVFSLAFLQPTHPRNSGATSTIAHTATGVQPQCERARENTLC
jgi:hypothetical protein